MSCWKHLLRLGTSQSQGLWEVWAASPAQDWKSPSSDVCAERLPPGSQPGKTAETRSVPESGEHAALEGLHRSPCTQKGASVSPVGCPPPSFVPCEPGFFLSPERGLSRGWRLPSRPAFCGLLSAGKPTRRKSSHPARRTGALAHASQSFMQANVPGVSWELRSDPAGLGWGLRVCVALRRPETPLLWGLRPGQRSPGRKVGLSVGQVRPTSALASQVPVPEARVCIPSLIPRLAG